MVDAALVGTSGADRLSAETPNMLSKSLPEVINPSPVFGTCFSNNDAILLTAHTPPAACLGVMRIRVFPVCSPRAKKPAKNLDISTVRR